MVKLQVRKLLLKMLYGWTADHQNQIDAGNTKKNTYKYEYFILREKSITKRISRDVKMIR